MNQYRVGVNLYILIGMIACAQLVAACQPSSVEKHLVVAVDGRQVTLSTKAATVREVLAELDIQVGALDRVEPDLWQEVVEDGLITVTRVEVQEESERRPIPFQQRTIKSEALASGERKLLQLGSAGEEEIIYRVVMEDGAEVERIEVLHKVIEPPVDEIIAVGVQVNLPSVAISGTIAYISGGNAWMMRETSASRRPLTSSGDLDGRVLALSPDGDWLLFSRVMAETEKNALNSLWIVGASVLNEEPQPLDIIGVIYSEWFQDGRSFVYSTAERIEGSPGWKARNDLWRARLVGLKPASQRTGDETITTRTERLVADTAEEAYSWWGTTFALSPDNQWVAYGRPDAVGVMNLRTGVETNLLEFALYHTYSEWVWVPELTWSPDSEFVACSAHGVSVVGQESAEDSPVFDVWVLSRRGELQLQVVRQAGMWSAPEWSPAFHTEGEQSESYLALGKARIPHDSQNSRYDLYVMDRDGSNQRQVFPPAGREGLVAPDLAWSPDGKSLVIAHEGNLYLVDTIDGEWAQLTADGHSGQPRWAAGSR